MDTITLLRQIQADSIVFYTKCYNLHWSIQGQTFFTIHKYLEDLYHEFQEIFDYVAEKLVQLDKKHYTNLAEMLSVSKIDETLETEYSIEMALSLVLSDLEYFQILFKELSNIADTKEYRAIANYADERVDNLQKHIWQVRVQI